MKKKMFFVLVIIFTLITGCDIRKVSGQEESLSGNMGIRKTDGIAIGDTLYHKNNFFGSPDSLRYLGVYEDSSSVKLRTYIMSGLRDIRFFSKSALTGSFDYLNPLGIYISQNENSWDLKKIKMIWEIHTNGYPICWGTATEFKVFPNDIDPLEETAVTPFTLEWTGIPQFTYTDSGMVELPEDVIDECTESANEVWCLSSYQSFLNHKMEDGIMVGTYPMNGYFSVAIFDEEWAPLVMGVTFTTPYGSIELMNLYDYQEDGNNFLVFLVEIIDGVPQNYEPIDTRFGFWEIEIEIRQAKYGLDEKKIKSLNKLSR